jgi:hypothetical protein
MNLFSDNYQYFANIMTAVIMGANYVQGENKDTPSFDFITT